MATNRGFDRVVNFSDAVVAIAITLLVLPLVDEASNIGKATVNSFLVSVVPQLYVFFLSFVIIAYYWFLHHNFFEQLKQIDRRIMLLNIIWLLGIVFIPFPTALMVEAHGPSGMSHLLYMGTMLYIALVQLGMKTHVIKHPELLASGQLSGSGLLASQVITVLLLVSIAVAFLIPMIGLWSLLLLWLTPLVTKLISQHRVEAAK